MEAEVRRLRKQVLELEKRLADVCYEDGKSTVRLEKADEPNEKINTQEFDYVEGWKIVDLKIMNEALEMAQRCGHSKLVLVEANKNHARVDLAAHLGKFFLTLSFIFSFMFFFIAYICITCGNKVIFSSSSYSKKKTCTTIL